MEMNAHLACASYKEIVVTVKKRRAVLQKALQLDVFLVGVMVTVIHVPLIFT